MVEFAWDCVRSVGRPVTLDGLEIVVTASAGVALIDVDHAEGASLRYADIAMFNAKTQRLGVEVYRDECSGLAADFIDTPGDEVDWMCSMPGVELTELSRTLVTEVSTISGLAPLSVVLIETTGNSM